MSHEDLTKIVSSVGSTLTSVMRSRSGSADIKQEQKESASQREISYLRSQVKGMEILLKQNAELEKEVSRLAEELDTATNSVIKRGYLYKWRDREISFASKWGLRYFVLQGSTLSYFGDAQEQRPRRTFDLSRCVVRAEGTKKNGAYHLFSLYVVDRDSPDAPPTLLVRLSSEKAVEANQWIDMLEQSCALAEYTAAIERANASDSKPMRKSSSAEKFKEIIVGSMGFGVLKGSGVGADRQQDDADWSNNAIETDDLSPIMLKRVQSSNAMLKKIQSRQTMAREILQRRAPQHIPAASSSSARQTSTSSSSSSSRAPRGETSVSGKKTFSTPKTFPGSKPMHVMSNASPLSHDVRPGEQNYRGFFNLGVIIMLLSHARIIIDSHVKYGFVPAWRGIKDAAAGNRTPAQWALSKPGQSIIQWCVSILVSYCLELLALNGFASERVMLVLNIIAGTCNIVLPTLWVWNSQAHPGACMTYLFQSVILWMKLISYAHANRDLRKTRREQEAAKRLSASSSSSSSSSSASLSSSADLIGFDDNSKPLDALSEVRDLRPPFLRYGQNINLPNLLWFCVAPTLTYQLNYPQAPRTRWPHVLTLLFRIGVVTGLILFSIEQYIVPTLYNSMEPLQKMNIAELGERVIKLSIPNTYVWLLVFYLYFHLWLNLLAELTLFGDRAFYKDWWNARTIENYWRNWNLPVHHWCLRHLYYPTLRAGAPKIVATFVVFAFSAAAHELILSVPFRKISMHAFFGMLGQAPLTYITKMIDKRFDNAFIGNAIFWLVFCVVGQPLGVIMFAYDNFQMRQNT